MKTYTKKLAPFMGFTAALCLSSTAFATDTKLHRVVVQTEFQTNDTALMTDIAYEAVLANAAARTLDQNQEWFTVRYRDAQTQKVTRNVNNSAESRYIDMEDGTRIEREIVTADSFVHVQKIDFEMGSGPKPDSEYSFMAEKLVLPQI